jgi:rhamnogalacturonyl hydrolase YesR
MGHMPLIPAIGRERLLESKFKAILVYKSELQDSQTGLHTHTHTHTHTQRERERERERDRDRDRETETETERKQQII